MVVFYQKENEYSCTVTEAEGTYTLSLGGKLDPASVPSLQSMIDSLDFRNLRIVVDLKDVSLLTSSGIRTLMSARKKDGISSFEVVNASSAVYNALYTAGLTETLNVSFSPDDVCDPPEKNVCSSTFDPSNCSFPDFLEHLVSENGNKNFLSYHGVSYTWADIDRCSDGIAQDLATLGISAGSHVGLCAENSINWVFAFFAIQKLGALACLLNPNYTIHELRSVSQIGDITHLVYGEMKQMKDENSFIKKLVDDDRCPISATFSIRNCHDFVAIAADKTAVTCFNKPAIAPDNVCIMIFTSGSTGKPKGVMHSAYGILNSAILRREAILHNENDKLCLILPMFHIFGLSAGLFSSAISGAEIVIPDSLKTEVLLDTIEKEQCTLFHSVPTVVIKIMNSQQFHESKVSSLRCIMLAGASATEPQMRIMTVKFPKVHFIKNYGLSEIAPVTASSYDDTVDQICGTIGRPVRNTAVRLCDPESGKDCPAGKIGEVFVRAGHLMCAYYKHQPVSQTIDERGWLHTGDLAWFDEDNYLHFAGRLKELIVRGGENIMPDEIASEISKMEDIADVKVVGIPDSFYGECACACIVMQKGVAFDEEKIRCFLSTRLAKFKIPAHFLVYHDLPKLANAKVDAVRLRKEASEKFPAD